MSLPWSVAILTVVLLAVLTRVLVPALPLRTRPVAGRDVAVLVVGIAGLVAHCGAMFYRDLVSALPGSDGYVSAVNGMGAASMVLYVLPAALVLVVLRRTPPGAIVAVTAALVAVGVTMYDDGSLTVHLTSILVAVAILAATVAGFVTSDQAHRVVRSST